LEIPFEVASSRLEEVEIAISDLEIPFEGAESRFEGASI